MLNKLEISRLLLLFTFWLLAIYLILYLSRSVLPLQFGFLGGSEIDYLSSPHTWAFVNFDGEHYLSIINNGYKNLQHFYFPAYILLSKFVSFVLSIESETAGLFVSRVSLIAAIIGIYKLVSMDYRKKTAFRTIFLVLIFPTSYYLASFYTESLFLALVVWSFYFARNKQWLASGLLGMVLTATRIVGLTIFPALFIELLLQWKDTDSYNRKKALSSLSLVPSGLFLYMYYLWQTTGDPLIFYNQIGIFGSQRSTELILLPQVFYRYFFKIIPSLDISQFYFIYFTILEIFSAVIFTLLSFYSLFKLRLSYVVFTISAFIIPTLSGSFSSLPRYVLVLFPAFLLASLILDRMNKVLRYLLYLFLLILLILSTSLFFRGYWIA